MTATTIPRAIDLRPSAVAGHLRGELGRLSPAMRLWLGGLMVVIGICGLGALLAIPAGDEVLGTSAAFEWGALIAAYVLLAVTTSGLCLVSALGTVFGIEAFRPVGRRAAVLAVICLVAAFGVIGLDLHHPLRLVLGVVLSPSPTSPMWWMGTVYSVYLGFLLLELAGIFTHRERLERLGGTLAFLAAIAAPSTLGAVFGVLVARPYWHGAFMPIYLLLTALLSGAAVLGVVYGLVDRLALRGHGAGGQQVLAALSRLLTVCVGVGIVLLAWQSIVAFYGGVPGASEGALAQLIGPLAPMSWLVRVGLGLLLPLAILLIPRGRTGGGVLAASALVLVGLAADRMGLVAAGQIAPLSASSGIVSAPWAEYWPSPVELAIVVGALAMVCFAYTLAERYLDLDGGEHRPLVAPTPAHHDVPGMATAPVDGPCPAVAWPPAAPAGGR